MEFYELLGNNEECIGSNEEYICKSYDEDELMSYYKNVLKLNGFIIVTPLHLVLGPEESECYYCMIVEKEIKQTNMQKLLNKLEAKIWQDN